MQRMGESKMLGAIGAGGLIRTTEEVPMVRVQSMGVGKGMGT